MLQMLQLPSFFSANSAFQVQKACISSPDFFFALDQLHF